MTISCLKFKCIYTFFSYFKETDCEMGEIYYAHPALLFYMLAVFVRMYSYFVELCCEALITFQDILNSC